MTRALQKHIARRRDQTFADWFAELRELAGERWADVADQAPTIYAVRHERASGSSNGQLSTARCMMSGLKGLCSAGQSTPWRTVTRPPISSSSKERSPMEYSAAQRDRMPGSQPSCARSLSARLVAHPRASWHGRTDSSADGRRCRRRRGSPRAARSRPPARPPSGLFLIFIFA
jgi:hypothetical protein